MINMEGLYQVQNVNIWQGQIVFVPYPKLVGREILPLQRCYLHEYCDLSDQYSLNVV